MMGQVIQLAAETAAEDHEMAPFRNPYTELGITCDDETAKWLSHQASLCDGARTQGDQMRLAEGEALCRVRDRLPGVFVNWLKVHWPEQSTTTAYRRIALWERRHELQALTSGDDDGGFFTLKNAPHPTVLETLAMGGAQPEVVAEVKARLDAGQSVTTRLVADLNREIKAKRKGQAVSRKPQPAEALAVSLIRKGQDELARIREAVALAERAEVVTAEQVMQEQRLRQLPKSKLIEGIDADFHRLTDGNWIRLPHPGLLDVAPTPPAAAEPSPHASVMDEGLMRMDRAAGLLGLTRAALTNQLTPSSAAKRGEDLIRNGYRVTKEGRGMVRIQRLR
jgi:hypothetical protein